MSTERVRERESELRQNGTVENGIFCWKDCGDSSPKIRTVIECEKLKKKKLAKISFQ